MTRNQRLWIFFGILLGLIAISTLCGCKKKLENLEGSPKAPSATNQEKLPNVFPVEKNAINLAWYFASSIDNDPEDQADYQAKVAIARFKQDNDIGTALGLGYSINRWNRGLVLAEVAESLARSGDRQRALAVIQDANKIAKQGVEQGWQTTRILGALNRAEAILGSQEGVSDLQKLPTSEQDNAQKIIATKALKILRLNSPTKALAHLDGFTGTNALAESSTTILGYDLIAREVASKNPTLAASSLDRVWASLSGMDGLLLISAQMDVVETALTCGLTEYARDKSEKLAEVMQTLRAPVYVLLPAKTRLAKLLAKAGDTTLSKEIANSVIARTDEVLNIEQPAILADAAATLYLDHSNSDAEVHFLRAIGLASELKNRRPRCKALCDIALSLYECKMNNVTIISALENEALKLR